MREVLRVSACGGPFGVVRRCMAPRADFESAPVGRVGFGLLEPLVSLLWLLGKEIALPCRVETITLLLEG